MGARRKFSAEYKREAVAMLTVTGGDGQPDRRRPRHRGQCPGTVVPQIA